MIFNIRCGCVQPLLPLEDFFFFFRCLSEFFLQVWSCRFWAWRRTASCDFLPVRLCSLSRMSVGDAEGVAVFYSSSPLLLLLVLPAALRLWPLSGRSVLEGQQLSPHLLWQTICILVHTAEKKAWFQLCLSKWTSVPYFLVVGNGTLCLEKRYNRKY